MFISVRDVVLDTVDGFLHIILYAKTCNFRQPDVKKTTTHYWLSIDARQMKIFTFFKEKDGMIMCIYIYIFQKYALYVMEYFKRIVV